MSTVFSVDEINMRENRLMDRWSMPLSLHIGIEYGHGGVGRIISELMQWLPAAGFSFRGIVAGPENARVASDGLVRSFARDGSGLWSRMHGARTVIREELAEYKPDIVASHFAMYTVPALDVLRRAKNVTHFHGPWAAESLQEGHGQFAAEVKARIERSVYRSADLVIVLSKAFGDLAVQDYRIDPERLRLIPGCVDVERFDVAETQVDARETLGLPVGRPILLSVRRLVRRMGLQTMMKAMRRVVAEVPEALWCIGGRGPLHGELSSMAESFALSKNVRFLGHVAEHQLPLLYRAADINIVPSEALEGFGLVAAEAMAAGTPSFVTPVGGLPEVVSELSPVLIFPSTSDEIMAEVLIQALRGTLRLPSADECKAHARANFTCELMATRTAMVYRELLT